MSAAKASRFQAISTEVNGRTYSAQLEIRGTRFKQFIVHYNGRSESDGRKWGTDAEEQHNMLLMAEAKLIQMAGDDE
jgi:hypothetical protein